MQINLKQPEIKKALELYVAQQGIQLMGKDVSIKFTAGRGETGLTADILITAADLPDFGDEEVGTVAPAAAKPVLTVVTAVAEEPEAVPVDDTVTTEVAEKPAKTASLFN